MTMKQKTSPWTFNSLFGLRTLDFFFSPSGQPCITRCSGCALHMGIFASCELSCEAQLSAQSRHDRARQGMGMTVAPLFWWGSGRMAKRRFRPPNLHCHSLREGRVIRGAAG